MEDLFASISNQFDHHLNGLGFEYKPFLIGWYNECVAQEFRLEYDENTLAFVVLSTPDMFEKAFLPLARKWLFGDTTRDPIDDCAKHYFSVLTKALSKYGAHAIHDFEMTANGRKPKILVQTAAHVSGAAYYYRPQTYGLQSKSMIGVCIHPSFGGWFAIRGIVVLADVSFAALVRVEPTNVVPDHRVVDLLIEFNQNWKDMTYRDIIPVSNKYSDIQINYFKLKPSERLCFLEYLLNLLN